MTDQANKAKATALGQCLEACQPLNLDAAMEVLGLLLVIVAAANGNFRVLDIFVPEVAKLLREVEQARECKD
jgi:hypothetical protein